VRTLLAAALLASLPALAQSRTWDFRVYLDEKPVGHHRFTLSEKGAERELTISARFDVKFLGFSVYRYAHDATEHWKGDCLVRLTAQTDDNGERSVVERAPQGCTMSFAYWNPLILKRAELLNAQTGEIETVSVAALGDGRYRITGPKHPIDLWYSSDGQWLALESPLASGRRLRYQLQ
jgi:hypothetical protein